MQQDNEIEMFDNKYQDTEVSPILLKVLRFL